MLPVVIPFFKNKSQLEKCKEALKKQTHPNSVWVVDDSDTGHGFTKSCNKGVGLVEKGDSDLVLLLNQDCYLRPDAIERMTAFMSNHPCCAIAGVKQLSSEDEDLIIHGGTLECFPAGRHEGGHVSKGEHTTHKRVPWVNGACMIVRLSAIRGFGLMDETMKMFCSDADWSYTARARGWETWYIADAVCVHEQGASKSMDEKMGKVFEQDTLAFRSKWIDGDLFRELSMEVFPEDIVNAKVVEDP